MGTLLLALVLLLTPLDVPSGWLAWAASGHVRPADGAWDTLWRALWLRCSWGTPATRVLFAGLTATYIFMTVFAFAARARASVKAAWPGALGFVMLTLVLRSSLANLAEGTGGMFGAALLLLAWASPSSHARAFLAGISVAGGPWTTGLGLWAAWLAEPRRTLGSPREITRGAVFFAAGTTVALLVRYAAFGDLAITALGSQGRDGALAAGGAMLCISSTNYLARGIAAMGAHTAKVAAMLRGAPARVMLVFAAGGWWAFFGAGIDAVATHDERNGAALIGAEYTGLPGAWVLHADGQSYARHLGAWSAGLIEPGTVHVAVYDPVGPGTDADLLELRRNVYFANIWPEDRVAALARVRPVYLASSPHMPANIVRYTLPERHLWRVYSEPRGATDRAAAMALTQPWFPEPARRSELLLDDETAHAEGSDRVNELRARVVFLLRTGDASAKYVALNQLAIAAPHDALLSDLSHACQSASPQTAADVVARKFASARTEAQTWRARFGE